VLPTLQRLAGRAIEGEAARMTRGHARASVGDSPGVRGGRLAVDRGLSR
jgi:hypothetical protein